MYSYVIRMWQHVKGMVKPLTSDIRMTYEYIWVTYEWHASTYEWHADDMRVHTSDTRMTYEYIRLTYGWHTSTYEWNTDDIRVQNLMQDTNFATFGPRKCMSIHGFWIVTSSISMVFVILLENDDVFKLSIYRDIYFFSCIGISPA